MTNPPSAAPGAGRQVAKGASVIVEVPAEVSPSYERGGQEARQGTSRTSSGPAAAAIVTAQAAELTAPHLH